MAIEQSNIDVDPNLRQPQGEPVNDMDAHAVMAAASMKADLYSVAHPRFPYLEAFNIISTRSDEDR